MNFDILFIYLYLKLIIKSDKKIRIQIIGV